MELIPGELPDEPWCSEWAGCLPMSLKGLFSNVVPFAADQEKCQSIESSAPISKIPLAELISNAVNTI